MLCRPLSHIKYHSLVVLKCGVSRFYYTGLQTTHPTSSLPTKPTNHSSILKRYHGDCHLDMDNPIMQTKEMKHVTYLGLGMNVILTATKAALGVAMNSSSVIADAVHSLSDMISDFVTLGTVSYSRRPPNKTWIYGYGKLESIASLVVSGILLGTAGAVIVHISFCFIFFHIFPLFHAYEFFSSLYLTAPDITQAVVSTHSHSHEMILHSSNSVLNGLGIGVLLASVGMKEWLYQQTMKIAKKTDSSVLKANAWHHRVDALSAVVALVGLSGRFIGLPWLDPLGGAVVGAVVFKTGCEVGWKSLKEILDLSVDKNTLDLLRKEATEGIDSQYANRIVIDDIIARKAGPHIHSVVRLKIDDSISLDELMHVKYHIEEEMHHIHNLQSVVIDITDSHEHEHEHHHEHEHSEHV